MKNILLVIHYTLIIGFIALIIFTGIHLFMANPLI